jgi:hypothetical protein
MRTFSIVMPFTALKNTFLRDWLVSWAMHHLEPVRLGPRDTSHLCLRTASSPVEFIKPTNTYQQRELSVENVNTLLLGFFGFGYINPTCVVFGSRRQTIHNYLTNGYIYRVSQEECATYTKTNGGGQRLIRLYSLNNLSILQFICLALSYRLIVHQKAKIMHVGLTRKPVPDLMSVPKPWWRLN